MNLIWYQIYSTYHDLAERVYNSCFSKKIEERKLGTGYDTLRQGVYKGSAFFSKN